MKLRVLRLVHSDLVNQNVAVDTELALHLPAVNGDSVQLQQVLLNLVINGCDAMAGVEGVKYRLLVVSRAKCPFPRFITSPLWEKRDKELS